MHPVTLGLQRETPLQRLQNLKVFCGCKNNTGMSQSAKKALGFSHVFDPELMCAQWSSGQGLLSHYTILWLHENNLKVSLHSIPSIYDVPVFFFVSITLQTILNKMTYHSVCIRGKFYAIILIIIFF